MNTIQLAAKIYERWLRPLLRGRLPRKVSKLKGRRYERTRACPWCFRSLTEIGIKLHQRKCEKAPKTGFEVLPS